MKKILSGHLNNKGVTLITLIIAITIFAVFITVFSYVMVAKHGSSALYVQSTQAYSVAQAGIEYGIRYAIGEDHGAAFLADPASVFTGAAQSFGNGSFTLEYNNGNNNLTSTGTVGVATRKIILSSFSNYVQAAGVIVLGDPAPYRAAKTIYVPLINNYGEAVEIYKIALVKTTGSQVTLTTIRFGGATEWSGSQVVSNDLGNPTVFTFDYTMAPGSVTLSLTASGSAATLSGTWRCTFCYNEPDPPSSSVEFDI
jgi:hypothetical protein